MNKLKLYIEETRVYKTISLSLPMSQTYKLPEESTVTPYGILNSPSSLPNFPKQCIKHPYVSYIETQ